MKNIRFFLSENVQFLVVTWSIYLNRRFRSGMVRRVFAYLSLDSPDAREESCDQRRL